MHHDCLFFVSIRDRAKFEKDPTVDWIEVLLATYLNLGATKVFFIAKGAWTWNISRVSRCFQVKQRISLGVESASR